MTKNQKIAVGCGGVGCLGLFVVLVAVGVIFYMSGSSRSGRSTNLNTNRNSNSGTISIDNNSNNGNNGNSSSSSSLSDDDKHKLYQAAAMSGDQAVVRRVSVKLGLMNDDFTPGEGYVEFVKDHVVWVFSNAEFIQSLNTKEKALAYVNEHFPE